jgi:hypothetical protein
VAAILSFRAALREALKIAICEPFKIAPGDAT